MNTSRVITKPLKDEYPEWFASEIEPVNCDDLLDGLSGSFQQSNALLQQLSEADLSFRYAAGKWSIPQILQHIIDVERVLCYRALRYARQDATVLSGSDENKYAEVSGADQRDFTGILKEHASVRQASIELFKGFTSEMLMFRGTAGKSKLSVRAVGFLILGHEIHHLGIIQERYLKG